MGEARKTALRLGSDRSHSRYVAVQMAKVVVPQRLFRDILDRIGRLRAGPGLVGAG